MQELELIHKFTARIFIVRNINSHKVMRRNILIMMLNILTGKKVCDKIEHVQYEFNFIVREMI